MADYVSYIRSLVGHQPIILTYAGGVLMNDKGGVLLQKRTDFQKWGLPGGTIEYDETASQACVREFKEETGLDVRIESLLGIDSNEEQSYPNGDVAKSICICFQVALLNEEILLEIENEETLELSYFSLNQLPEIFSPQHQRILEKVVQGVFPFYD